MNHAHTRSTRVEWHFNFGSRGIAFKTNSSTNAQLGFTFVDDRNRCLPVAEVGRYRFQSEEESLVKLGRSQHLRSRLDKDVILARARAGALRLRKGWGRSKS